MSLKSHAKQLLEDDGNVRLSIQQKKEGNRHPKAGTFAEVNSGQPTTDVPAYMTGQREGTEDDQQRGPELSNDANFMITSDHTIYTVKDDRPATRISVEKVRDGEGGWIEEDYVKDDFKVIWAEYQGNGLVSVHGQIED